MTTINGKKVLDHYRSLENLPDIITEMEWYGNCSDRNGNLDKNEALCVVNYVGDEMITVDDYQLAKDHSGLSSLLNMTPGQFWDLVGFFQEKYGNFPRSNKNNVSVTNTITLGPSLQPVEKSNLMGDLERKVYEEILPLSLKGFYKTQLKPHFDKLDDLQRQAMFEEFLELDPSLPEDQFADHLTAVLREYKIPVSIDARPLSSGGYFYLYGITDK